MRPVKVERFQYAHLTVANLMYKIYGDTAFKTEEYTGDTLYRMDYGLKLELDYQLLASLTAPALFPSGNKAFAKLVRCPDDQWYFTDTVKKLSISTLQDIDADHPRGSDMSDNFILIHQYSGSTLVRNGIPLALESQFSDRPLSAGGELTIEAYFQNNRSFNGGWAAFQIDIEFTNGKTLSAQTNPVFLQ